VNEFLSMGGYAFYVWTSYAITAVALAIEIATVRARRRAAIERARTTEVEGASSTLTAAPDAASKS